MADATAEFFEGLASHENDPRLGKVRGTLRVDLRDDGTTARWFLTIDKGDIAVSRRNAKADCVIRADQAVFEGIARGELNPFTAILRGAMEVEGKPELLVLFRRMVPIALTTS